LCKEIVIPAHAGIQKYSVCFWIPACAGMTGNIAFICIAQPVLWKYIMDVERLKALLEEVRSGALPVEDAVACLRDLPYEDIGCAKLDHHRALRTGFPEIIYCPGKAVEHVIAIARRLRERARKVLATRAAPEVAERLQAEFPAVVYHTPARIVVIPGEGEGARGREGDLVFHSPTPPLAPSPDAAGVILVVSAGTADLPVAEEAAVTAAELGSLVERLYDVGVAGLHRLLDQREKLFTANVLIVVAGMEGALASVVGGLVSRPVIAVPTSVGYGASFQGLAALLAMLNSCASGVAVMNIDNGFGAGYFAHLINQPPIAREA
jgi:NCAIR mutase (PurE)-related protein